MRIPVWLTLGFGALIILWGGYRVWLGLRPTPDGEQPKRTGLHGMGKRAHLFVGAIYMLLGAGLIAISFGFNPFA